MLKQRLVVLESAKHELLVLVDELDTLDTLLLLEDDLAAYVFGAEHQQ